MKIKNPLSGIRGAAQLLEQAASPEDRMLTRLICDEAIVRHAGRSNEVFGDDRPVARGPVNIHSCSITSNGWLSRVLPAVSASSKTTIHRCAGARQSGQLIQVFLNR